MSAISENGVLCTSEAWRQKSTVTLEVPIPLLTALQAAWQGYDRVSTQDEYADIVRAVRDLFDGEDGALQFLAAIGIETRPT